jgi:translation initiation factor IF-2
VTQVILTLLKWGVVAAKNQLLNEDVVIRVAEHYQATVTKPAEKKSDEHKGAISLEHGEFKERPPVVVVVGHVDHGKTTLLDFIRKTRVAAREKGGITQHLGAYEASTPQGNVVFIDTPGHEAFSKMRMRGVKLADLAILVVAADDGVMPQTVEAIKHTQAMGVPIIVAINKVDKVEPARIEQVKQQLSRNDLLPEEWGGNVVVVPISAKMGTGIDHLLEMIVLQSQLMELKADVAGQAKGYVLESKVEKGRGPVATVLAQHGHISVGDYFVCGSTVGKISSLVDSHGARVTSAGPSIPVRVAGFSAVPEAGDYFEVVSREKYLTARSAGEQKVVQPTKSFAKENSINLIIKTDSKSSKEALLGSIAKVGKKGDRHPNIINASIGDISESDVTLAATTGSIIFGLHVKPGPNALSLAQKYGVKLELHDIIYKLLERLEEIIIGMREVKFVKEKIGEAVAPRI